MMGGMFAGHDQSGKTCKWQCSFLLFFIYTCTVSRVLGSVSLTPYIYWLQWSHWFKTGKKGRSLVTLFFWSLLTPGSLIVQGVIRKPGQWKWFYSVIIHSDLMVKAEPFTKLIVSNSRVWKLQKKSKQSLNEIYNKIERYWFVKL